MNNISQLNELLITIINVMIIPLLPVITTFLIALIKKKTSELEAQIRDSELQKYLDMADNAIVTAVTSVSQTYSDGLKRINGNLLPEQQKTALDMARIKAVAIIGESGMNILQKVYGDVDTWLENRIEYYVNLSKTQNPFSYSK